MKKIIKYMMVVLITGSFLNSCETADLDLRVDPNALSENQLDPNLILNSIQFAYVTNMQTYNTLGSDLTRIDYMFGRDYFNNYPPTTFSGNWARTYSSANNGIGNFATVGMWTNIQNVEAQNTLDGTGKFDFHEGVGKALLAHNLLLLTDYLGTAAFSQAGKADEFPSPMLDDGPAVYAGALGLLDEAEALLSPGPAPIGASDFFYDGDSDGWIKFINTVRLKAAVTTGDSATFNSIISGGNYIADSGDDMEFQYGARQLDPDTRHPIYAGDYTPSGAGNYRSNWLMNNMLNKQDPRLRYYFYRQSDATPGADAPSDEENLACSSATPPLHYDGFVYCFVPEGYWGRSHGNDEGGPPDGFLKAAAGVYPYGGRFDDNSFGSVGLGLGGQGAGIEPIILASDVAFWRGQNALATGGDAAAFLRDGMEKSIAKVGTFAALDATADKSVAPDDAAITAYIDGIIADYNAATGDDKMNIFAEQYWISMYGGGAEAYNFYRKTGFPTTLAPNWEADPGPFPRTFLLPANEAITNTNITQRTDMNTQVFWDTNPAGPAFPPAN